MKKKTKYLLLSLCVVTAMGMVTGCSLASNECVEHTYDEQSRIVIQETTCTQKGKEKWTCKDCGEVTVKETPALGHNYDEGEVTEEATCMADGKIIYTCSACSETKWENIAATGHSIIEVAAEAPTCTKEGTTAYSYCEYCGEYEKEKESILALGHQEEIIKGTAATCTSAGKTDGKYCAICGEVLVEQEEIPALGHQEEVVTGTAATCTSVGKTDGKYCSVCDEVLVGQEEIPALGHQEEVVTGTAATCMEDGKTDKVYCLACQEILQAEEDILALGHNYGANDVCSVCGDVKVMEGLEYTLSDDGTYYALTGIGTAKEEELIIPTSYNGKPVTVIGKNAFQYSKCNVQFTKVTLPEGIERIEDYAFEGQPLITEMTIPRSVTYVGVFSLRGMETMKKVEFLSDSVQLIGPVFGLSNELEQVIFHGDVEFVSGATFSNCPSLRAVVLLSGKMKDLADNFILSMPTTANFYVPRASLDEYKAKLCWQKYTNQFLVLEGSEFAPNERVDDETGSDAETLIMTEGMEYTLSSDGTYYTLTGLGTAMTTDIVIPAEYNGVPVTSIGCSFAGDVKLTSVHIPEGIENIGMYAFQDQDQITELVVPKSVKAIQPFAFCGMTGLTEIIIPGEVIDMAGPIFGECTSLERVVFESKVEFAGSAIFRGCTALKSVEFLASEMCTASGSDLEIIENVKIYVPASLLETYKTDEGWSLYANQFEMKEGTDGINNRIGALTFTADGVELDRVSYDSENQNIIEPAVPEKTGYTGAWENYSLDYTEKTVNAVYTPIEYTITYISACSDFDETNDNYYVFGSQSQVKNHTVSGGKYPTTYTIEDGNLTVSPLKSFFQIKRPLGGGMNALDGYGFGGWYLDKECTQAFSGTIPAGRVGNITLYAKLMYSGTNY